MSTLSDTSADCLFCSGPVVARDLHAAKRLCNLCTEEIAHSWSEFISACSSCGEELSDICIEEGDVVLCRGCGGESVAAAESAP